MFGLGMPEILLILAIALIVIGPKKLPDLAKTLGRALGEFKSAATDFKKSLDVEPTVKKFNGPADSIKEELKDAVETAKIRGARDFGDLAGSMSDKKDDSMESPDTSKARDLDGAADGSGKTDRETEGKSPIASADGSVDGAKSADDSQKIHRKDTPTQ